MKKLLVVFGLALLSAMSVSAFARGGDVQVNGYYRANGTYVEPYVRSAPDSSYNNNYSTSPNVNPYTAKTGSNVPTWDDKAPLQQDNGYYPRLYR